MGRQLRRCFVRIFRRRRVHSGPGKESESLDLPGGPAESDRTQNGSRVYSRIGRIRNDKRPCVRRSTGCGSRHVAQVARIAGVPQAEEADTERRDDSSRRQSPEGSRRWLEATFTSTSPPDPKRRHALALYVGIGSGSSPLQTPANQPSFRSLFNGLPAPRKIFERLLINGPIVKGRRIKVRSVRPHQCLDLRINRHLVE